MLLMFVCIPVFGGKADNNKPTEFLIKLSPFAIQKIHYWDNKPEKRISDGNYIVGIGFFSDFDDDFCFGGESVWEQNSYEGFHSYENFRFDVRLKTRWFFLDRKKACSLGTSLGVGVDFVLRDDSDYGCYPLFILSVLDFNYAINDKFSINATLDYCQTFQKGSAVSQMTPFIGLSYCLNADKKGQE